MIWCFAKKLCMRYDAWDMMHEQVHCHEEAASYELPELQPFESSSFPRGIFNLNTPFDADLLLYSLILNATATQDTCSLSGVYHPHWLVQWSHHRSHICIPVHSPWLPGYINVLQTILVILTMAGLFPDRLSISENFIFHVDNTFSEIMSNYFSIWSIHFQFA